MLGYTCMQLVDGLKMWCINLLFMFAGSTEFLTGKMEQLISLFLPFKIVH